MKILKNKWVLILIACILIFVISFFSNSFLRVKVFVWMHSADLEERILYNNPNHTSNSDTICSPSVPMGLGINTFNLWEGEHDMIEFSLFASGFGSETTYYGCYYSFDDVPLAFQNTDAELIQNGHAYWEWQGEGDNHGATQKLKDNWYYFEASF